MDSVNSVGASQVQSSQPYLTKKGLETQDKNAKHSPEAEKIATQETASPPQTPSENAVDVTV